MILSLFIIICFLCAMEYSSFLSLIDADFWFVSRKWGVIIILWLYFLFLFALNLLRFEYLFKTSNLIFLYHILQNS